MSKYIELKWSYTPRDYFEDKIKIEENEYILIINDGVAIARVKPENYDNNHQLRSFIHDHLNQMFSGAQLLARKPFKISESTFSRVHPDGRRDITLFINSTVHTLSSSNVDIIAKDKWGNVVADTKRDRFENKIKLARLASKFKDNDVLKSLLSSFQKSINDPENELIYLYEIRDALKKHFGNEEEARTKLNIGSNKWAKLGRLANEQTIKQGRHRGQALSNLRDATPAELNETRNIAFMLVESYFEYLEKE